MKFMKEVNGYIWKIKRFDELTTVELYEILKARAEVFVKGQKCAYQDMDDKDKKAWHMFLENNGNIAAYLRILDKGVGYEEIAIGRVLTTPKYRGRGFANIMLERAIAFVEEHLKEEAIRIFAQTYVKAYYEKYGFRQVSDVAYNDGKELIEMVRNCNV